MITLKDNYSYFDMQADINSLKNYYSFIETGIAGYSVLGKSISYIKIGDGAKEVFYSASIHANEWITAPILIQFISEYCLAIKNNANIYGYSANYIFGLTTIYFIPMINPDGVDLVTGNIDINSNSYIQASTIASNFPNITFPNGWKANINGVDLNLQFPAEWQNAKKIKYAQGFSQPSPRDFVGFGPLTEPEALAVYNFTITHNFSLILAYHTQGKEIYWRFQDYLPPASYYIGEKLAQSSRYSLSETPYNSSFAGFKDWFIQNYNLPGYTIEAGLGENPLPFSQFNNIYADNLGILVLSAIL